MATVKTRRVIAADDHRRFTVGVADDDARLDHWLTGELPDLSRSQIQRLIHEGHVRITRPGSAPGAGESTPSKAGHRVTTDDEVSVTIPAPEASTPVAEDLAINVIYQDAQIAIVNKPAGMVVHPAFGHGRGTLVNALLHHFGGKGRGLSTAGGGDRPGIVHRLDKGTSGLMVVARTDVAHRALSKQFHDRLVTKEYTALVWGTAKAGTILDKAIGRDPRHRTKMSTRGHHTRAASTTILSSEAIRGVSLVTVRIGTGRTHQIRVHLSESGHAVVGDDTYGGVKRHPLAHLRAVLQLKRPFLHAHRLSFAHPRTGKVMTFDAPLADDLQLVLTAIQGHTK